MIRSFAALLLATAAAADRPRNVLFVYVEDLGYCTSERAAREPKARIAGLKTPNLDALAKRSVVFTRAFCGQSVCSPSKAAIYTGLPNHANGVWRNVHNRHPKFGGPENWIPLPAPRTPQNDPSFARVGGVHEDVPTLIELLKPAGVFTALSHKLHVQPARKFPFDRFVGFRDVGAVAREAGERPWLFWCNFGDTHAPFWKSVAAKLADPKDPNSAPTDVDPAAITMPPWLPDTPASRVDLAQYYSNVQDIDAQVGEVLAALEASGQAGDTLVVFTGDHGIPVQRGKMTVYPAGTHVPLFVAGPGVEGGRLIDAPVSQMDLFRTFLQTFGVEGPPRPWTRTLWPILSGQVDAFAHRSTVLTETNESFMSSPRNGYGPTAARAVCDGRLYYVRNLMQDRVREPEGRVLRVGSGYGEYGDPRRLYRIDLHDETVRRRADQPLPYELLRRLVMNDAPREELYDLDADPWATADLMGDPAHAEPLAALRGEMDRWLRVTEDPAAADPPVHPGRVPRRTRMSAAAE